MLKKEMKEIVEALSLETSSLKTNNETLTLYVKQLQVKVREQENVIEHYEKTMLVLTGRLQEKSNFISEQNNEINRRNN